jgi:hypothetical protein
VIDGNTVNNILFPTYRGALRIVVGAEAAAQGILAGSRYFCESLFWASQPKQAAKT